MTQNSSPERSGVGTAQVNNPLIKNLSIVVDEIVRSKRKTIALIVRADGSLLVRAPLRASDQSIREFVAGNVQWIQKKQAQIRTAAPQLPKGYVPGEQFNFLGNSYPLEIVEDQKKPLLLDGTFKLATSAQANAASVFEHWYRDRARRILPERVQYYASRHGFQYKKIGITGARTRWGSCSATGSLNFSWRLILAPVEAVDYVVVHELVHTKIHNHSRKFWKHVEQVMPDYKERRKWLRQNGGPLLL